MSAHSFSTPTLPGDGGGRHPRRSADGARASRKAEERVPAAAPARRDRLWLWFLLACVAGLLVLTVCVALRWFTLGTVLFMPSVTVGAVGAITGVIRFRPRARTAWLLLAVSQALFALGCVAAAMKGQVLLGIADILFIAMAPPYIGAIAAFTRWPTFKRHPGELLDGGIVATGVALVIWLHIMEPLSRAHDVPVLARLVLISYPVLDLAALVVALRLAVFRRPRPMAYRLFTAAVITFLITDICYVYLRVAGDYQSQRSWFALGYVVASTLFGTAALHPSMTQLGQLPVTNCTASTGRRIAFLSSVSLIVPAELAVAARHDGISPGDSVAIGVACVVLLVLILTRMAALE